MKYRKRPVIVEAEQWKPTMTDFPGMGLPDKLGVIWEFDTKGPVVNGVVTTIHGQETKVAIGDWVIKEPDGIHHYPCKAQIFEETYSATSTCAKCGKVKNVDQFYVDKKRKNGCHTYCIECAKINAKKNYKGADYSREQARIWREKNPRENKSIKLKHAFGITIDDYEKLLDKQSRKCAICSVDEPPDGFLCVDHDHTSGAIRGLLCHSCNKGLGFFADNAEILLAATIYCKPDIFEQTYEKVET